MDYGLINDETYPEADYLKKSMYGFGFWDKTDEQKQNNFCLDFINEKILLGYKSCRGKTATSQWCITGFVCVCVFFFANSEGSLSAHGKSLQ